MALAIVSFERKIVFKLKEPVKALTLSIKKQESSLLLPSAFHTLSSSASFLSENQHLYGDLRIIYGQSI